MDAWITRDPLRADEVLARVGAPEDGAVILFLGTVRDHNDGRRVSGVRYDAYVPMAEEVLRTIVAEALERLSGGPAASLRAPARIVAAHRIGELDIGEASVAIAVSSPHRAEAFDACRYIIEEIKRRLPVWKEEHYADGDARWLEGCTPPIPETARE